MIFEGFSWVKKNKGGAVETEKKTASDGGGDLFGIFDGGSMESDFAEGTPPDVQDEVIEEEAREFTERVEADLRADPRIEPDFATEIIAQFNEDFSNEQKSAFAKAKSRQELESLLSQYGLSSDASAEGSVRRTRLRRECIRAAIITVIESKNNPEGLTARLSRATIQGTSGASEPEEMPVPPPLPSLEAQEPAETTPEDGEEVGNAAESPPAPPPRLRLGRVGRRLRLVDIDQNQEGVVEVSEDAEVSGGNPEEGNLSDSIVSQEQKFRQKLEMELAHKELFRGGSFADPLFTKEHVAELFTDAAIRRYLDEGILPWDAQANNRPDFAEAQRMQALLQRVRTQMTQEERPLIEAEPQSESEVVLQNAAEEGEEVSGSRQELRRTLARALANSARWSVGMLTKPRTTTEKLERTTGVRLLTGKEFEALREYFGRGERFRDALRVIGKRHLGIARLTNDEQILFWRARIALSLDDENAKRALTKLYRGRVSAETAVPEKNMRSEKGRKQEGGKKGLDLKKFPKTVKPEDLRTLGIINAGEANRLRQINKKASRKGAILNEAERSFVTQIFDRRQKYLSTKGGSSKKSSRKKKR